MAVGMKAGCATYAVMRARRMLMGVVLAVVVGGAAGGGGLARAHATRRSSDPVLRAIGRAATNSAVGPARAADYRETYAAAVAAVARLRGLRARELRSEIAIATRDCRAWLVGCQSHGACVSHASAQRSVVVLPRATTGGCATRARGPGAPL